MDSLPAGGHTVVVYVLEGCANCAYAKGVAEEIRRAYPHVAVRMVDLARPGEPIPEAVFAAPTYLLDGNVWSLGNPSPQQVKDTLSKME